MHLLECPEKMSRCTPPDISPVSIYFSPSPPLPPWPQLFVIVNYWKLVTVVIPLEVVGKIAIGEGVGSLQTFQFNGLRGWP